MRPTSDPPDEARPQLEPAEPTRRRQIGSLPAAARASLNVLLVAAAVALVAFVLIRLRLVVIPVVVALLLATILGPPKEWVRRRGLPNALATFAVMVAALAALAGVVALTAPAVADELGDLGDRLREGVSEVGTSVAEGRLGLSEAEIDEAIDDGIDRLRDNAGPISRGVLSGAVLVGELIAAALLTIVLLFFFLRDGTRIWSWLVELVPARHREHARELGPRCWATLSAYVRGVALVAVIDATLIGIGLAILGVPLVLPLAILTFFAAFLPLVGAVVAGLVAALVALVSDGVITALLVVAVVTAVQQLDGDVVFPAIVGRNVRLHPVAILLVLTAGGIVGGIIGALLAVPAAAVAWTVINYARELGPPPQVGLPEGATPAEELPAARAAS